MPAGTVVAEPHLGTSRWRASPAQLVRLLLGLWLFGTGTACIVEAGLGNEPWVVLAEGLALRTSLRVGTMVQLIGAVVLCAWLPLRERPGLGTVANVIVVGFAIDVMRPLLPVLEGLVVRGTSLLSGIVLIGAGSGLYLTARLGPGPRDGLMTGLHRRFGLPLWLVRLGLESSALTAGWLLGGTVGVGTVAFAALIGPAVQLAVRACGGLARRTPTGHGSSRPGGLA